MTARFRPFLLVLSLLLPSTAALWPFKQKRFIAEAFINAGPLGTEEVTGRVVAVGDWDGDQKLDIVTLSDDRKTVQLHLWDRDAFTYKPSHALSFSDPVTNIVPGDFNHDGRLDLLVMYEEGGKGGWWGGNKAEKTGMKIYLGGGPDGGFQEDTWDAPSSMEAQPIIYDADGSLRPSLLGYAPSNSDKGEATLQSWHNTGNSLSLQTPPLNGLDSACELASPHSSAFIDINGDCLPDLVLHCEKPQTAQRFIQIWLNQGQAGFLLSRTYDLPKGSGPLSFADMDRDGTMDIIFPVCSRTSASAGTGSECSINIAYNQQIPICSSDAGQSDIANGMNCRGWAELCVADDKFEFEFDPSTPYSSSIPISKLFPTDPDLLLHAPGDPSVPLPIRPGDYNVDGFPDLLLVISNDTAIRATGGVFGASKGTQMRLLENTACRRGVAGCDKENRGRGLKVGGGKGWEVMDSLRDVTGASWVDVDDDGSLDILVQRSGDQGEGKITFVQNNIYHDAFFLKAQMLNGACDHQCQPTAGGKKYSPLGVSYSGATYKFTVLDTLGRRVAQQSAQLPQSGYHALGTPYSFIGLGRTNNYVERLFVGSSLHVSEYATIIESLIPNSQIIINPPSAPISDGGDDGAGPGPVKARSTEWRSELFLHPGDWVPWVGAAVVGTVLVLGTVVLFLDKREKREDEKERQRALHAINFQAL